MNIDKLREYEQLATFIAGYVKEEPEFLHYCYKALQDGLRMAFVKQRDHCQLLEQGLYEAVSYKQDRYMLVFDILLNKVGLKNLWLKWESVLKSNRFYHLNPEQIDEAVKIYHK